MFLFPQQLFLTFSVRKVTGEVMIENTTFRRCLVTFILTFKSKDLLKINQFSYLKNHKQRIVKHNEMFCCPTPTFSSCFVLFLCVLWSQVVYFLVVLFR